MSIKNSPLTQSQTDIQRIVGWKIPVFHQASECYVSLVAFDPNIGKMHLKKIMLGHIKSKREQRIYGQELVKRLTEKLMDGWNPWIEISSPEEYSIFDDVCDKYKEYLLKLMKEDGMRPETIASYTSKLHCLQEWIHNKKIPVKYTYQFNHRVVSQYLDYVFVERNNTLRTRNNHLLWLKSFSKYLLSRGYINKNPTESFTVTKKYPGKSRSVIPDEDLVRIKELLMEKNRYYLLACYILHYLFVRPHEMTFLKIKDFSVKRKTLILHGDYTKNKNDAVITIPNHVMKFMIELGVLSQPAENYLFSEDFMPGKKQISEKKFRDYWLRYVRTPLNLSPKYKFYSLKDTGITNMIKANTDILSVRDQARHSSVLITDIYTPKDIQAANKLILGYKGIL